MNLGLRKLSTRDLATLAERVITATKQSDVKEAKKHVFLEHLEKAYKEYSAVLSKTTYSGKGKSVAQADKERDVAFSSMKSFLTGYVKLPSAPFHEEALALNEIFKTYGVNISRLSYSEQTAQLNKLIDILDTPEHLEKMQKLSLETAFNEIKTTNDNFKSIIDEQAQANSELRETQSASVLRKDLEKALKRYLDLVTLMFDMEGWKTLYNKFNEFVKATKKPTNSKKETSIKENS
ncbi:DUF6261 family protein [Capnocytophaga catalasegens]|uniref:Uncharacterized protein n=1 Tax=Capnocytophaga catalasegens TaxID=1004260 RepID=A0AAV5AZJ3_9FLAO|nr:DUF6261 family protein [Capnocytophaga catalasegens]GIZ15459.1 hypothetical protein RCZ03_14590 [Capnocytophaga catalasegens]GJM51047.1 hypothetical protein RCZ15_20200 [Capnocytophaga catalasegens]GJM52232.1 hypothetical protein RCZ16_05500 [Capnocytophaga catalasegens]